MTALINTLLVNGVSWESFGLSERVTKAVLSGSIDQVTQLEIDFIDPNWDFLGKGILGINTSVKVNEFNLEVSSVATEDQGGVESVTVQCRPTIVRDLRNRRGPRVMSNVSPTEFVSIESSAVGAGFIGQSTQRRSQIARDVTQPGEQETTTDPKSSWTTFKRLAEEVGFAVFESAGVIYFGKPSWLISQGSLPTIAASYLSGADSVRAMNIPQCRRSQDDPNVTVAVELLPGTASLVRPGKMLVLSGVPTFNGNYIITSFDLDLLDPLATVSVNAATPIDPTPQPPA